MARVIYDLLFFFIVIIIVLNLIFGVIIDTFADLRSEKQQKEEILKNTCFVCGKNLHESATNIKRISITWDKYVITSGFATGFNGIEIEGTQNLDCGGGVGGVT